MWRMKCVLCIAVINIAIDTQMRAYSQYGQPQPADEPVTGEIPPEQELLNFITAISQKQHVSIVLVAHQISSVATRCSHLAIINKYLSLFAYGDRSNMLTSEQLSNLYRYPVRIEGTGKGTMVLAGPFDQKGLL